MPYQASVSEFRFLLDHVVGFERVADTDRFAEATPETVDAILTEAGRLCQTIVAPLQRPGDTNPARLENGIVRTPPGFGEAFAAIAEGGWIGISADPDYGGMGLPLTLTTAFNDMMAGACLAMQLNPLMSQGQIEALEHHASDELKALYLPKLISGEWCGTMNLTEPQAGSDVGALSTKAEPNGDGTFAITGQKIYITWGDNDFSDNVCHLVLARLPDGQPGTRGISLFLVPKYIPDADGTPGERNSLQVVSLEHKLGLHGSPTAVMEYSGATGWLVGPEHGGMAAMFTMMNNARLGVGTQGVGVADAAFQLALAHATGRKQGKAAGSGTIVEHADVRRMLAGMKADLFAARAITLACAVALDMAKATGEDAWAARAALLTPIAKAFGTDIGEEIASTGIQVHGGMGFIEETGAAQLLRDVRVTSIYEGTNGIQAMDLVGRKLADKGEAAFRLIDEICAGSEAARAEQPGLADAVYDAAESLRDATEALVARDPADRFADAVPYLRAFARVLGGHFHLVAATSGEAARTKLARFYIDRLLPEHASLLAGLDAADAVLDLSPDELAA
ncbi:acyl-CoA dehydrogenase [Pelagovum pacificum]|uniref:3-methylmercaptopropionyl-CoA dehydrogenase n=1 Tax=Pelagovum pacificum TaxID=2588711 RepID=A0A5C5GIE7_9RHOB|nr:acyl-CoA dehydrogenase [Pelagovum pacificum]QQA43209.1 acyl-CoA dehydrogenase [Pelagovum pacificum]TNY33651.1 acyl-CoA dehydrogenase [Pelagovum pacificum]